ncbi:MAG: SPOR domain-containing protein [Bacteroidales bacterium]|nr:SPOR domain-containing protein [Bacteroidales bacterium]
MKKTLSILLVVFFIFSSCKNEKSNEDNNSDDTNVTENIDSQNNVSKPNIEPISDANIEVPFYIISISATETAEDAVNEVTKLRENHKDVNYLWIPDYESLSGKKMFVVFLGPYSDISDAYKEMISYKKENAEAYVVEVSHYNERVTLLGKFDYRINDVQQKLIIAFAESEALDEYFEEGGEDWMWFTYDVDMYFQNNYPTENISFFYGEPEWLTEKDMLDYAKELGYDDPDFGYYLIDGKNSEFLSHDMSNYIIEQACSFFGLEVIWPDYE